MRMAPGGGTVIGSLLNVTVVEVLPDTRLVGTVPWALILTPEGLEGWVLQAVLAPLTPAPAAAATFTTTP